MKKQYLFALMLVFVLGACNSSLFATYRPAGSMEAAWQIDVTHKSGVTQNFKVVINDSTVIDDDANFLTGNAEAKGVYRGKEVKLMVTYSKSFFGGEKFTAMVFISNELAGKFDF